MSQVKIDSYPIAISCAYKSRFAFKKNIPAALCYLAMIKKGAIFKTVKDNRMTDFNEAKWQTSALKNAFVLLTKRQFEHAVAFFLLAGRLKDAVEVLMIAQDVRDLF